MFQDGWLPSEAQQLHFCRAYVAEMQQQAAAAEMEAGRPPKRREVGPAEGADLPAPTGCDPGSNLRAAILAAAADGGADGSGDATEAAARLLQRKAAAHMPLVHLKWGLWGLIQVRWGCRAGAGSKCQSAAALKSRFPSRLLRKNPAVHCPRACATTHCTTLLPHRRTRCLMWILIT